MSSRENPPDYSRSGTGWNRNCTVPQRIIKKEGVSEMLCEEVMTRDPKCCTPADTAERVARMMQIEDVGAIPVCNGRSSKQLVGIVTDRDLCLEVVASGRDPSSTRIDVCMSRDPVTCRRDEDLEGVVRRMEAHQIRRIPVVDNDGGLVGIISQADIATRSRNEQKTAGLVHEISRPAGANL